MHSTPTTLDKHADVSSKRSSINASIGEAQNALSNSSMTLDKNVSTASINNSHIQSSLERLQKELLAPKSTTSLQDQEATIENLWYDIDASSKGFEKMQKGAEESHQKVMKAVYQVLKALEDEYRG